MYGVDVTELKLLFDGEILSHTDCPNALDMCDEDLIDVQVHCMLFNLFVYKIILIISLYFSFYLRLTQLKWQQHFNMQT